MSRTKKVTAAAPAAITIDATADLIPGKSAAQDAKHASAALAGWKSAAHAADIVAHIRAIGETPEAVATFRPSFVASYLGRMFSAVASAVPTPEAVAIGAHVLRMAGAGAKEANASGRRTAAQETAYATARKAWERALKDAGVKTTDARGGAREKVAPAAPAKPSIAFATPADRVSAPAAPVNGPAVPKFARPQDVVAFAEALSAQLRAAIEASPRASHPMLLELATEISGAIAACRDAIGE